VIDANTMPLEEFYAMLARTGLVRRLVELAADEDLGILGERDESGRTSGRARVGREATPLEYCGDITTDASIPPDARASARVVARGAGVIAGLATVPVMLDVFTTDVRVTTHARDGQGVEAGAVLATLEGPTDEVLALERTLLNMIGRLSGIATQTSRYARAMGTGHRAGLYDTRKTTPGLRVLEKYAVRCGGGKSHRLGLHDAVLLKDNHLAGVGVGELAAFVARVAERARALSGGHGPTFVECEVDSLEQLDALLALPKGVLDIVLLDNMDISGLREACARRDSRAPWLELEASGGVTLETIGEVARTGVDRISVGALTHSAVQLDVALDF
jgi:nicotinate-nucleotide pyrophosphorylase (carboxylating)